MYPTNQARGDNGKEPKTPSVTELKKKKKKNSGGQFSSGQMNQQFVPTAAKSDCKGSTGSSGLFLMAV